MVLNTPLGFIMFHTVTLPCPNMKLILLKGRGLAKTTKEALTLFKPKKNFVCFQCTLSIPPETSENRGIFTFY